MKRATKPTWYFVLRIIDMDGLSQSRFAFIHVTPAWHIEMLKRLNRLRYFQEDLDAICHIYDIGSTEFYVMPQELKLQWEGNLLKGDMSYGFVAISRQERNELPLRRSLRGKYELVVDKHLKAHYRTTAKENPFCTVAFDLEQIVDPKIVEKYDYL